MCCLVPWSIASRSVELIVRNDMNAGGENRKFIEYNNWIQQLLLHELPYVSCELLSDRLP